MASATVIKKAFTLPPTVRTLANGVPTASLLNIHARAATQGEHHEGHGHAAGPRSDVPAKFASSLKLSSQGLVQNTFASCTSLFGPTLCA